MKIVNKRQIFEYLAIIAGAVVAGFSISVFLVPFQIAAGGVSGLATVIYYVSKGMLPIGTVMLVLNIPLLIYGLKVLGKDFILKTIIALFLLSTSIDFFEPIVKANVIPHLTSSNGTPDLLLNALVGGTLMGIGLGICLRFEATTGGSDLLASILARIWPNISTGNFLLLIDVIVISIAMIVFNSIMLGLYGLVALYVSTKIIDILIEGVPSGKIFYIISENANKIGEKITNELGRGATFFSAAGAYKQQQKQVIMCTVNRTQVQPMKRLVYELDHKAFVILVDAREVLGEGFRKN